MTEPLGYGKHAVEGREGGNSRNGTRTKTVLTDNVGPVAIEVPRDRDASFEPTVVRKRQRRLGDVDTVVLSLYAKGLSTLVGVHRAHVELYIRQLGERPLMDSSVNTMRHAVRGYFRFAHIDGLIGSDPAVYARLPKIHRHESPTQGVDRLELIRSLQVAQTLTVHHGALADLLGINALRASDAAAVRIQDYADSLRGYRVLHLVGKGNKPATMPVTVPVLRVLEACRGQRTSAPLILRPVSGNPVDRRDVYRVVTRIAQAAAIPRHISPHSLRPAAITNALDAGVPLRDAQILARHADPRTTEHYDRARGNLDRHGVHFLTAYVAGVGRRWRTCVDSAQNGSSQRSSEESAPPPRSWQEANLRALTAASSNLPIHLLELGSEPLLSRAKRGLAG